MTPWISLGAALLGAVVGSLLAAGFTRGRERKADLRAAVADYIAASVAVIRICADARRNHRSLDMAAFAVLNSRTTETEQALWLRFGDGRLAPLARAVAYSTGPLVAGWQRLSDDDWLAGRIRAREAQVALFEAARDRLGGSADVGLPPHLSWKPNAQGTADLINQ